MASFQVITCPTYRISHNKKFKRMAGPACCLFYCACSHLLLPLMTATLDLGRYEGLASAAIVSIAISRSFARWIFTPLALSVTGNTSMKKIRAGTL